MTTDAASYQAKALNDLDTQIAVWNSRLQVLDSQIQGVKVTIDESRQKLSQGYTALSSNIENWLTFVSQNPETPVDLNLVAQVKSLGDSVASVNALLSTSVETPLDVIAKMSEDLSVISDSLLATLMDQTQIFSNALASASADLQNHFGITI